MQAHAFRIKPNQDLQESILSYVREKSIEAGCILSAVGSLKRAAIRLSDKPDATFFEGPFEIVSITGTVSIHGAHIHLSISDDEGKTIGGHLMSGCLVYTTAEIVIGELPNKVFLREPCSESGYHELVVKEKGS